MLLYVQLRIQTLGVVDQQDNCYSLETLQKAENRSVIRLAIRARPRPTLLWTLFTKVEPHNRVRHKDKRQWLSCITYQLRIVMSLYLVLGRGMCLRSKLCQVEQQGASQGRVATGIMDQVTYIPAVDVQHSSSGFEMPRPSALFSHDRSCGTDAEAEDCLINALSVYSGSASFFLKDSCLYSTYV